MLRWTVLSLIAQTVADYAGVLEHQYPSRVSALPLIDIFRPGGMLSFFLFLFFRVPSLSLAGDV